MQFDDEREAPPTTEQDGLIGISLDQTPTRHLMVLLCAFCTGLSYCDRVNLSVAVVEMSKDLDWDLNQRAIVLSSFFYGYVCSQIPSAYMARIYGGHVILGVAAFCWSLSTIAVPFLASVSFRAVVCGRIVLGLFEGCTFPVIYHLFSSCVPVEERSRSLGTIALGVFSGAIFSFIVSPILMHHYGWSTVFYFFGFLGFLWCGMWFAYFHVFVRDRPGPTANHPSTSNPCADTQQALKQLKHLVCHKVVLAIFWCHFCHNIGTFVMMSWLPTYFTDAYQLEGSALAFTCLPYISMGIAVSATSRVADSYIASGKYTLCYVRRASTLAGFAGAGTFMILIPLFASPIFGIFCMCVALALNGAGPVAGYESAKFDIATIEYVGRLQSISNTLAAFAGIVGVPMVALIKNATGSWNFVFFTIALIFYSAGLVFYKYGHYTGKIIQ